jgi:putative Mn2+ efflux pump MntP
MAPLAIAVLALSMSADAFAAAIGQGAARRPSVVSALKTGLVFGVIEGVTPIIGWGLGLAAAAWVAAIDHWIAFILLGLVGGKMIWEAVFRAEHAGEAPTRRRGRWAVVATAIGTSIDACVIGVTLALIGANIWVIAASIGFTTFVLATLGLLIGKTAGARLGSAVELVGGVLLIGLGVKILLEHLGVIGW